MGMAMSSPFQDVKFCQKSEKSVIRMIGFSVHRSFFQREDLNALGFIQRFVKDGLVHEYHHWLQAVNCSRKGLRALKTLVMMTGLGTKNNCNDSRIITTRYSKITKQINALKRKGVKTIRKA